MADKQTIDVYNASVATYLDVLEQEQVDEPLRKFIDHLSPSSYVLDLGCGPGRDAWLMQQAGLSVDPVDASVEMVEMAKEKFGLKARLGTFSELDAHQFFDGVWANFSLLHAPAADFPAHLRSIFEALKPGGVFHIGMKIGDGEIRDKLGRQYAYYSEDQLLSHLGSAGFAVESTLSGEGVGLAGDVSPWVTIVSKR